MHTVTVTQRGDGVRVLFERTTDQLVAQDEEEEHTETLDEGPSPITPEIKELLWGLGAFLVFLVLMRLVLFPRLREGMTARYGKIQADHAEAEATRETARAEVAEYEQALDAVKAEAAGRVDVARRQLEQERSERLAEVNQRIADRRATAVAEGEAAREAARDTIEDAVADVATLTVERSVGEAPDGGAVREAVRRVMGAEVPA